MLTRISSCRANDFDVDATDCAGDILGAMQTETIQAHRSAAARRRHGRRRRCVRVIAVKDLAREAKRKFAHPPSSRSRTMDLLLFYIFVERTEVAIKLTGRSDIFHAEARAGQAANLA
jgi:hypothetical protein